MNIDLDLSRDAFGKLVLIDADGVRVEGVEPVRAFPLTAPSLGVGLYDELGREVGWIDSLEDLPPPLRTLLQEELRSREFLPTILKVEKISSEAAPSVWTVETDRGPTQFTLETDDGIRRLGSNRVLISDAEGLRFQIPDSRALPAASRVWLDRYL